MTPNQADGQHTPSPKIIFDRMIAAANRHDLDAMVGCYAPEFRSEQPFHPERNFTGPNGVHNNWSHFFATMPDFQIDVLDEVVAGDAIWAELCFQGTLADGTRQVTQGVTLVRVQGDHIVLARLYIETVAASS